MPLRRLRGLAMGAAASRGKRGIAAIAGFARRQGPTSEPPTPLRLHWADLASHVKSATEACDNAALQRNQAELIAEPLLGGGSPWFCLLKPVKLPTILTTCTTAST